MQGCHCIQVPLLDIEIYRVATAKEVTVPLMDTELCRVVTAGESYCRSLRIMTKSQQKRE